MKSQVFWGGSEQKQSLESTLPTVFHGAEVMPSTQNGVVIDFSFAAFSLCKELNMFGIIVMCNKVDAIANQKTVLYLPLVVSDGAALKRWNINGTSS